MVAVRVLNSMLTEAGSGRFPRTSVNSVLLSWLWKKGDSCTCSRETVCVQTVSFCEMPKYIVSPIQKQADRKRQKQCLGSLLPAMVHSPLVSLLLHVKVKLLSRVQLCNPMDCNLPGSTIHGVFQARILEWVAISFSRRSSWPRDWTQVSRIVDRHFTVWATNSSLLNLPTSSCLSITNPDHEGSSKSIWGLHTTIWRGLLWFLWLLADPAPGVWEPSLNIWVALLWPPTPQSAQYHCLLLFNSH